MVKQRHINETAEETTHIQLAMGQPSKDQSPTTSQIWNMQDNKSATAKLTTYTLVVVRSFLDKNTAIITKVLPQNPTMQMMMRRRPMIMRCGTSISSLSCGIILAFMDVMSVGAVAVAILYAVILWIANKKTVELVIPCSIAYRSDLFCEKEKKYCLQLKSSYLDAL